MLEYWRNRTWKNKTLTSTSPAKQSKVRSIWVKSGHPRVRSKVVGWDRTMAIATGFVGSFAVMRKMSLAADPLLHIALPGIGFALALHAQPVFGATLAKTALSLGQCRNIMRSHFRLTGAIRGLTIGFSDKPLQESSSHAKVPV